MKCILITGARGYIGSQLALYLSLKNFKIIALDIEPPFQQENSQIIQIQEDFSNLSTISSILEKHKPEVIIHAAAKTSVLEGERIPDRYHRINTEQFSLLVNELNKQKWKGHLIFCSTSSVYGNDVGLSEIHSLKSPLSVYGKTKIEAEKILTLNRHHFTYSIVRLFNVAGYLPYFSGILKSPKRVMQILYEQRNSNIICNYSNINSDSIQSRRDYVHITDTLTLFEVLLNTNRCNSIINCGSGASYTVEDLAVFSSQLLNCKYNLIFKESSPKEALYTLANNQYAQNIFSWKSYYSIEECLKSTFEYFRRIG